MCVCVCVRARANGLLCCDFLPGLSGNAGGYIYVLGNFYANLLFFFDFYQLYIYIHTKHLFLYHQFCRVSALPSLLSGTVPHHPQAIHFCIQPTYKQTTVQMEQKESCCPMKLIPTDYPSASLTRTFSHT